jgi:hypothetical protein
MAGDIIAIKYIQGCAAHIPTLNINGSGDKGIICFNFLINSENHFITSNGVVMYYYDGVQFSVFGNMGI